MRRIHALVACLAFAAGAAQAETACTPPTSWPLGHHVGEFAINNDPGTQLVTSSGWDPAYFPARAKSGFTHQALKTALITGVQTYQVGLVGANEPNDLSAWSGSCNLSNASLAAAGATTISLTAEGGGTTSGVYLIDSKNFYGCGTVNLETGVLVAFYNSALRDLEFNGTIGGMWMVDSLVDVDNSDGAGSVPRGSFIGGEQNSTGSLMAHVMYSEMLGGRDSSKTHNMSFYRSHAHAVIKTGDEHVDGFQINSRSEYAFLYENNIEMLFRHTNRPVFLQNSNSNGIHDTWVVNNLISGGSAAIDTCNKTSDNAPRYGECENTVICGNRALAANQNVSWASPSTDNSSGTWTINGGDGIIGTHERENNCFYNGTDGNITTSILDNEDGTMSCGGEIAVSVASKNAVNAKVTLLETWATEIRAAAGAGPPPSNVAPVGTAGATISVAQDSSANAWAGTVSDADGASETLSCTMLAQPANGTATVTSDCDAGTVAGTYTPDAGYVGGDSWTWFVSDGEATSTVLQFATVTGVNQPPTAGNVGSPTWHDADSESRFLAQIVATYQLAEAHTPYLVFSGNTQLNFGLADPDGLSLRVYDQSSGAQLPHCLGGWDQQNETARVFVRVPANTTQLGLYFNASGTLVDEQECDDTTFNTFDTFWTFQKNDATPSDLSGNGRHLTNAGSTEPAIVDAGAEGLAAEFDGADALQWTAPDYPDFTIVARLEGIDGAPQLGRVVQFTPTQSFLMLRSDDAGERKNPKMRLEYSGTDGEWETDDTFTNLTHGEYESLVVTYDAGAASNDPAIYPGTTSAIAFATDADVNPGGTRNSTAGTSYVGNRDSFNRTLYARLAWLGIYAEDKSASFLAAHRAALDGTYLTPRQSGPEWVFTSGAAGLGNDKLADYSSDPEGDAMTCALAGTPNYQGAWGGVTASVAANCSWVTVGGTLPAGEFGFDFTVSATGGSDTASAVFIVQSPAAELEDRGIDAYGKFGVGP